MGFRSSLLLSLMVLGCAAPPPPGEALRSSKARVTVAPDDATFSQVVRGNTQTALALHRELVEGDDSLFFSPLSIQAVLGMAAGGAAGETLGDFGRVLPLSSPADFHRSMNHLDRQLGARGARSSGAEGEPFALLRMNQLFVDAQQPVEAAYLDLLAEEYGAGVQQLPLRADPAGTTKKINEWVSQSTKAHIPRLLNDDAVTADTRLVLVNAMYFSAGWAQAFTQDDDLPFMQLDGVSTNVTLMRNPRLLVRELETADAQVVSIPYSGDELSLRVVMPKSDYRAFEAALTAQTLDQLFADQASAEADLSMPPVELRSSRDLKPALEKLGMKLPFSDGADFSPMTGAPDLKIDWLVHEAWVEVSKSGTRAAAATAGGFAPLSAPPPPKRVIIDKPFLFFIVDDATGAVLFMGRYTRP